MNRLGVYHRDQRVGQIDSDSSGRMGFQYASTWLQTVKAFPVSLSLPLRSEPYGMEAHSYFANLLPEADVRQRLCSRLKVTPGNDFELLKLIGGECAGALTINDEQLQETINSVPEFAGSTYRLIEETQLEKWSVAQPDAFASTVGRDGVRLSLAGAQDKLPVKIEGGPSLEKCADVIRNHASIPATELVKLLRWTLFNWLAGNSDAHGKNISLLFGLDGAIELAPFYDLVCTRIYKSVDRNLAMSLGGQFDPGKITGKNLSQLASELQIGFRMVDLELRGLLAGIRSQMESTITKFELAYRDSAVLQMIPQAIAKQLRRAESTL